jgi:choline-sulfatase
MPPPLEPAEDEHERPLGILDRLRGDKSRAWMRATRNRDVTAAHVRELQSLEEKNRCSPVFEPHEIGRMRANYAGNVSLIDHQIGTVLNTLEERGEMENTMIIFTSDHGEMNGDYGLIYKKNFIDSAVHIPLIISTPETRASEIAGRDCPAITEWIDLGPTLVELAGGRLDYRQFGRSLAQTLADPFVPHREDALSELLGEYMLVHDHWKIALNTEGRAYLLLNLREDSRELRNLAGLPEYREVADRLRLRVLERIARSHTSAEAG